LVNKRSDADAAEQLALGLGHIGVAGTDDHAQLIKTKAGSPVI